MSEPVPRRRPANVSLPDPLLRDARALGINISAACEQGLSAAVAGERRRRWLETNRQAIADWNDEVERHGMPLAEYRRF